MPSPKHYYHTGPVFRGAKVWCHNTRKAAEEEASKRDRPTSVFSIYGTSLRTMDDLDMTKVVVINYAIVKHYKGWRKYAQGTFTGSYS